MPEPARKPMAADEFLDWDDGTDTRHELVDGVALAMTPTTDAHGTIAGNAWGEANHRLESRSPCRTVAEASVRLDDGDHYKADVAATCAEPRGERFLEEPFLVVEVLSESTEGRDLGVKLQRYLELPHLREIWLIDSRKR